MDHRFTDTQLLLKRAAADFFSQQYPLDRLRDLESHRGERDPQLWNALIGLGWTAAPFPEEIGGFEGSLLEAAPLLEEMGRAVYPSPYVHSCVAAGLALASHGSGSDLVKGIAAGRLTVVLCGHTGLVPQVSLDDGVLRGRCLGVPWPELATHFVVSTERGLALVVAAGADVSRRNLDSTGSDSVGEVFFNGQSPDALFPSEVGLAALLAGAAGTALMLVGASERALDLAVEYAKMRVQFGQPIGAFQAIQHKCANMLIDVELARGLAYKAGAVHGSEDFPRLARFSKSLSSDVARTVTRDAIQIHGGVGFIDNHRVQLPYRMATSLGGNYQAPHEHRAAIAAAVLGS